MVKAALAYLAPLAPLVHHEPWRRCKTNELRNSWTSSSSPHHAVHGMCQILEVLLHVPLRASGPEAQLLKITPWSSGKEA